jgi:molybdopterin-synthase adenylyltransferase
MPQSVTVLASQMEKLRRDARVKRLRVVEGVAFRVEGEDVCHAFTERPPYRPVGRPESAFFVVDISDTDLDSVKSDLKRLGAGADSAVILLSGEKGGEVEAFSGPELAVKCKAYVISPSKNKRGRGLLESDALIGRQVFIIGVGSFGSTAAVELAKAGVGRFVLADMDRLEPGNVMRHACGVADIGRFKTLAVRDAILAHNPDAVVKTAEVDVNEHLEFLRENVRGSDLTICLTDERRSRFNCNAAAVAAGKTAIFARAITRAAGGDVFRYRAGGPCLACLFGSGVALGEDEVGSNRRALADTPDYAPEGFDENRVQPGLAADIAPIVQMVVKLALVELAPREKVWECLREDLEAPFYIWANRRDEIYADWQPLKYYYNRSGIMRWYGVRVPRDEACLTCAMA